MRNSAIWSVVLTSAVLTGGCGTGPDKTGPPEEATPAAENEITLDLGGGVTMGLVLIPAGEFTMGSPDSEEDALDDEKPQHPVKITKAFYLGTHEVTQEQWQAIMGGNPRDFKAPRNPVENVSWDDCQAFLTKLNAELAGAGNKFSLPTEAQWEYACRAGSTTQFSFADEEASLGEYAWYDDNSGGTTHPVGQKKPNAWGIYDMHGNAWEWCRDWYDGDYYGKSPTDDPIGPTAGSYRVGRGGGWCSDPWFCRSAFRFRDLPVGRYYGRGFRVASVPIADRNSGK